MIFATTISVRLRGNAQKGEAAWTQGPRRRSDYRMVYDKEENAQERS